MATEVQTRPGTCPTHGAVQATRSVPTAHFPFVVYGVRRMLALRRPFRCPNCDEPVKTT